VRTHRAPARTTSDWLADYAREIDNVRAALEWAFLSCGNEPIAAALTAAAVPLWMRLSLLEECRSRAKQALDALATAGNQDRYAEMRLHAALGASTSEAPELGAAFEKALDIAESLGDREYQLRTLRGLNSYHVASGRYRAALPFAQKFHDVTSTGSDQNDRLFDERMMGVAKHFIGDQLDARLHLERVLTHFAENDLGSDVVRSLTNYYIIRFHTDLRISAHVYFARVLWLQGLSDQAVRAAETSITKAQETGHALSLCYALALAACPIAVWVGNLAAAAHYTGMLLDHSRENNLPLWNAYGSSFHRVVTLSGGGINPEL
jgi:tetratricopeptide (TPR) repeat protein